MGNTLNAMQEDQFLVIAVKQSNRFIQFTAQGAHALHAEVTSNAYLSGAERWTDAQMTALKALGWFEPTGSPEASTPGGSRRLSKLLPRLPAFDTEYGNRQTIGRHADARHAGALSRIS